MSLADDLRAFIASPTGPRQRRDELARRLFEEQCEAIPEYGRFAARHEVRSLGDIPPVPEIVYKALRGPRRSTECVKTFRSSGTSGSQRTEIELSEIGLELMNTAIESAARAHLFADGQKTAVLLLLPSPEEASDVIMVYGMDLIGRRFGCKEPRSFVAGGRIDFEGLTAALERETTEGCPVFLAGGSFVFVHFLEYCRSREWRIELPAGSRTLDAGGFKGRSRSIAPSSLRCQIRECLGVPENRQTNLLGMTELASQIYDAAPGESLGEAAVEAGELAGYRAKKNDPWTTTRVIDPRSGEASEGLGMLQHVDLAIYDRPCSLLTADLGTPVDGGFVFVRRAAKVSHRGCSLTYEEMETT